jgi:hypothetical protein
MRSSRRLFDEGECVFESRRGASLPGGDKFVTMLVWPDVGWCYEAASPKKEYAS